VNGFGGTSKKDFVTSVGIDSMMLEKHLRGYTATIVLAVGMML
jgi:hypothetical protein